jgi:putative protease
MNRRPELLSPAGNWECLRAAVANGADAIYFGTERFNARLRADNFRTDDLPEVMDYLHQHGVRGFVTFNTLIFTDELRDAEAQLLNLAAAGVDAIIVQDLGLTWLARHIVPELELHASTQMTITSPEGLELARELGISRAVLARELSLRELKRFDSERFPLEVFVHGALCVAYSGQCLTSESLGQRSANRGECAQACRLPYDLIVDGERRDLGDKKYLLSPQDLAGIEEIPELIRTGIVSFKIEGRLKSPEYVAAVTRVYRDAIDRALNEQVKETPPDDIYQLEMTFSRGLFSGWLHGVNHQRLVNGRFGKKRGPFLGSIEKIGSDFVQIAGQSGVNPGDGIVFDTGEDTDHEQGGRVYEVRDRRLYFGNGEIDFARLRVGHRVWKTDDPQLNRRLRQTFDHDLKAPRVPLDIAVSGRVGERLRIRMTQGDITVDAESELTLIPAKTSGLTDDSLREQLGKLGTTAYELRNFVVEIEGRLFMPIRAINQVRREAVAKLEEVTRKTAALNRGTVIAQERQSDAARSKIDASLPKPKRLEHFLMRREGVPSHAIVDPELIVLCRSFDQIDVALEMRIGAIYVDFEDVRLYREAVERVKNKAKIFLATPRIQKSGEQGFFRLIENAGPDGVLVRNLGAIGYFRKTNLLMHGDFSLNVANPIAAKFLLDEGLNQLTVSYDLSINEVLALLNFEPAAQFELTIHQHMPMFHMEHCVFAAFLSDGTDYTNCGRPCDSHTVKLRDRVGSEHLLKADVGCRNTLFNARAQTGAQYLQPLLDAGLRRFRLEFLSENRDEALRLIQMYRRLLIGEIPGNELWRDLKIQFQLGVTKGSLE